MPSNKFSLPLNSTVLLLLLLIRILPWAGNDMINTFQNKTVATTAGILTAVTLFVFQTDQSTLVSQS